MRIASIGIYHNILFTPFTPLCKDFKNWAITLLQTTEWIHLTGIVQKKVQKNLIFQNQLHSYLLFQHIHDLKVFIECGFIRG